MNIVWGRAASQVGTAIAGTAIAALTGVMVSHAALNTTGREGEVTSSCPTTIATLAPALLEDFASYHNRTLVRSRLLGGDTSRSQVLLVSEPEILTEAELAELGSTAIEGFFFTTLERTDRGEEARQQQGFHQIFLTRDVAGWLLVSTRSGRGDYPAGDRMTPPRESNSGLVAQTIRTWLRDCEAG